MSSTLIRRRPIASEIALLAAGDISALTLQAAVMELDAEKTSIANLAAASGASLVGANASQTQDEVNLERVSVKRYNAVGDGVTDDTAALGNADTQAVSVGAALALPDGDYLTNTQQIDSPIAANGGVIKAAAGQTITLTGPVFGSNRKVFDGDGTFTIALDHRFDLVPFTLFGDAVPNSAGAASANAKALRKALEQVNLGIPNALGRTPVVVIPPGIWHMADDDADGVIATLLSYSHLWGCGSHSVLYVPPASGAFDVLRCVTNGANHISLKDFSIWGAGASQTNTQNAMVFNPPAAAVIYSEIENVFVKEMKGSALRSLGLGLNNCKIRNNLWRDCFSNIIYSSTMDEVQFELNKIRSAKSGNHGALFDGAGNRNVDFDGCHFDDNALNGLYWSNTAGRLRVTGGHANSNGQDGLSIDRSDYSQITGFYSEQNVRDGILLDRVDYSALTGNVSRSNGRFGMLLATCTNNNVTGGVVLGNSTSADNTYNGIDLQSISVDNMITGVTVRHGGGAAQHKWGISVSVDSNTNVIAGNDIKNSGKTASLSNLGTGTVTLGGNRA